MEVAPSQGSHFFQNITSFMVGYFTVNSKIRQGISRLGLAAGQPPLEEKAYTRLLQFENSIIIKINGHLNKGSF